jgi:hypothetical protein
VNVLLCECAAVLVLNPNKQVFLSFCSSPSSSGIHRIHFLHIWDRRLPVCVANPRTRGHTQARVLHRCPRRRVRAVQGMCIKYFSLYSVYIQSIFRLCSVYVQCEVFAILTLHLRLRSAPPPATFSSQSTTSRRSPASWGTPRVIFNSIFTLDIYIIFSMWREICTLRNEKHTH